jgi:hypothetical protein
MWSKQASITFSFQVYIRSESSMVSRLFVIILFSAVFFLFSLRLLYGSFGHLSLLPVDDWRVCLQVMNFLCFYVSFISQTSSLQLFSSCCCCCCWRGGWILCCWKHWIDWEGLWLLWVCCAGTWQALIICGQHIQEYTHAVPGSFKDSFKFPPFFPSHKHDAIIVLFLGFREIVALYNTVALPFFLFLLAIYNQKKLY